MLVLVLAESALETVPESLWTHRSVQRYVKQCRKPPQFVLLDRSYHHAAMKRLENGEKRGRPDIVHFALLEALGSPLNKEGLLQVYVHTINDYVISVDSATRLPRNYSRFVSLIEQLYQLSRVPPKGTALLSLRRQSLAQLFQEIKPSYTVAFSRIGKPQTLEETASKLMKQRKPTVLVGGFPRGHFSKATLKLADEVVCLDSETLETWTVTSRIIYEYERALSLPEKRLRR